MADDTHLTEEARVSTGVAGLDEILHGGLTRESIAELTNACACGLGLSKGEKLLRLGG